jgi:hypothetical protein
MPAVQARQISELLQDLQSKGTVRNAEEYSVKLQELSAIVNSDVPEPSFQQIRALVWSLCSSDAHNTMMQAIKNDLEAAFLQVDEIGKKIDDHHELLMKNMIADLERGINEQENYIRKLEWLADQNNEFAYVLVNSFVNSSLLHVPRTDLEADSLYFDNRTYEQKSPIELPSAIVSERGEKLLLDVIQDPVVNPVGVLFHSDENSYETEVNVDIDNPATNIIDGKRGTFWFRNVYLNEKVPKVTTVIEFDLGRGIDINYVIVEGGAQEPFFVESIEGITPDNYRIDLDSTSREVDGKIRIDFSRVFVRSVKITFAVYTYHKMNYWTPKDTEVHEITNTDNRFNKLKRNDSLAYVSRSALASESLADLVNIPTPVSNQINSYRYTLALDNVWFGNDLYKSSGIFVSKPLKVNNVGTLSVRVDESSEVGVIRNSIEYEIIKIDRSPRYRETRFPIPKIEQSTVTSERLIFTKRIDHSTLKNVATLRFCPYIPNDYTGAVSEAVPINVYLNGQLLEPGTDWEYAFAKSSIVNEDFDWKITLTDGVDFSQYTLSPPKVLIKILNPTTNGVYTVDYTIRTSDYNIDIAGDNEQETVWLDADKTAYLNKDGHVNFKQEDPDTTVESDVYLQITLRRNKASQSSTPELYEYAILAASYN